MSAWREPWSEARGSNRSEDRCRSVKPIIVAGSSPVGNAPPRSTRDLELQKDGHLPRGRATASGVTFHLLGRLGFGLKLLQGVGQEIDVAGRFGFASKALRIQSTLF